jgi:hypothetical protein
VDPDKGAVAPLDTLQVKHSRCAVYLGVHHAQSTVCKACRRRTIEFAMANCLMMYFLKKN